MRKCFFILIITVVIITVGCSNQSKSHNGNPFRNLSYYKENFLPRYEKYKSQNNLLSDEDVVTHVNIGLDQPYYTNTKKTPFLNKIYILSNKYFYMDSTYVPDQLEKISSLYSAGERLLVREARIQFEQMAKDAKNQGYTIRAMSSYRSYQYQESLYNRYVEEDGVRKADTYSARPGYSEHQTGLVVDVDNHSSIYTNFGNTKEFQWMMENAYKYGFILRYPEGKENITGYTYESWHYRYVGREIAWQMRKENLTFDEYYMRYLDI